MLYVDTSVVVALLTAEPKTPHVTKWFAELDETPISSDWLLPEFSSAMSIKLRSKQLSDAHVRRVRKEFELLISGGIQLVALSRSAFSLASDMVKQHRYGLRAGHSLHLAVGVECGASHVATLDVTFAQNVRRNGIRTIDF